MEPAVKTRHTGWLWLIVLLARAQFRMLASPARMITGSSSADVLLAERRRTAAAMALLAAEKAVSVSHALREQSLARALRAWAALPWVLAADAVADERARLEAARAEFDASASARRREMEDARRSRTAAEAKNEILQARLELSLIHI